MNRDNGIERGKEESFVDVFPCLFYSTGGSTPAKRPESIALKGVGPSVFSQRGFLLTALTGGCESCLPHGNVDLP